MKRLIAAFAALLLVFFSSAFAEDYTHINGEAFYNQTADDIQSGSFSLNPSKVFQSLSDTLLSQINDCRGDLVTLLVIAVLSSVLRILKNSDGGKDVSETAFFACFTLMTVSALKIFTSAVGYGVEVIDKICEFITKLIPIFAALLVSGGAVTSASAFHPVMSAAIYIMTLLTDKCIVPLVYFSTVLGIVGHITPNLKISAFTSLLRSAAKWLLMSSLTVFTGITAIYGFSAPVFDAVAIKGIKFAVGTFVPVVGGILSETVDTVLTSTKLMKSAVGTAGITALISICSAPVIKLAVIYFMLKLSAAASEPFTDKRISDMLAEIAASVSLVLAMVITASTLFIICIAIMLGATN